MQPGFASPSTPVVRPNPITTCRHVLGQPSLRNHQHTAARCRQRAHRHVVSPTRGAGDIPWCRRSPPPDRTPAGHCATCHVPTRFPRPIRPGPAVHPPAASNQPLAPSLPGPHALYLRYPCTSVFTLNFPHPHLRFFSLAASQSLSTPCRPGRVRQRPPAPPPRPPGPAPCCPSPAVPPGPARGRRRRGTGQGRRI